MSEKRRGLGRGLGALIPDAGTAGAPQSERPVDVWFRDQDPASTVPNTAAGKLADDPTPDASAADVGAGVVAGGEAAEAPVDTEPAEAPVDTEAAADGVGVGTASTGAEEDPGHSAPATSGAAPARDGPSDAEASLAPVPGASYGEVRIDAVRPNPRQPRRVFDEDEMAELAQSVRQIGVLQPIVVRRVPPEEGVEFELIMGERRLRASRDAGRETIPAIIKATDEDELLRDALLENLHRSDLNPLEEAAAYQQLLDDFGCTQEELSGRIGRSRPQISNTLRLLRLPPMVARRVAAGVLSAGHARALLTLEDGAEVERLAQRIVAEGLSVRNVEEIVALGMDPEPAKRTSRETGQDPQMEDLAGRVSDRLDTRVKINVGKRKGKMTIEFATVDDLHRVLGQMGLDPDDA